MYRDLLPVRIYRKLFLLRVKRVPVKTEAGFNAADPWNGNHRTRFTVESYKRVDEIGLEHAGYRYTIRSGIDGAEHMLPDSLCEMWRTNRIPIEALPRLLHQMKPNLIIADFRPMLENMEDYSLVTRVCEVLFGLFALAPIAVSLLTHDISPSSAVIGALLIAAFSWCYVYFSFYRKKWRRERQMKWILAAGKVDESVKILNSIAEDKACVSGNGKPVDPVSAAGSGDKLLDQARIFTRNKEYSKAEEIYRTMLQSDPSNVELKRLLASALFHQEKINESVQVLNSITGDK